jgi:hypothetical protein
MRKGVCLGRNCFAWYITFKETRKTLEKKENLPYLSSLFHSQQIIHPTR